MSLSDLFNISRTVRRDKARQQDLLPVASSTSSAPARLCNICYAKPATYQCPRCNVPFCSTVCFRKGEHQECSNAFSSSEIGLASGSNELNVEESERRKVVDILGRLERDEREARQVQLDKEAEEEEEDEAVEARADITDDQIESAAADALLAMLTPKERQRFMDAIKNPQAAASLMERLDRKAERRARLQTPSWKQGVLVAPQQPTDIVSQPTIVRREWQSQPWYETPEASFNSPGTLTERSSSFIASLEEILSKPPASRKRKEPTPVDLVYNLCAVLMAYAYTLRHLDVVSLSGRSNIPASLHDTVSKRVPVAPPSEKIANDDDEPPPLEPDSPTGTVPDPPQKSLPEAVPASTPSSHSSQDPAIAQQAFAKLCQLVPFLSWAPAPNSKFTTAAAAAAKKTDHSKLVLTSLDDASMWLLSRLSLDSEVGQGGADAINLLMLEDLAKLLEHERLVPSFGQGGQGVDPKFRLASKLASVSSPQQAFVAAQTPLLLNAIADIYFFFEDLSLSPSITRVRPIFPQMAQRKLSFYLCSVWNADQQSAQTTTPAILSELQHHIQTLRRRIDAANQADKIAAAVSLFNSDTAREADSPMIDEAS